MGCDSARLRYAGSTPGADSNSYVLFDTTALTSGGGLGLTALGSPGRFVVNIRNDQTGTLRAYRLNGSTWEQAYPDQAVAASSTGGIYDFFVGTFDHFRLVWVNGGSAQTVWSVDMALLGDSSPVT